MMGHDADGFAFPSMEMKGEYQTFSQHPGMTLKDYFAAAALTGLLGQFERYRDLQGDMSMKPVYSSFNASQRKTLADRAYQIATSMLDARAECYLD